VSPALGDTSRLLLKQLGAESGELTAEFQVGDVDFAGPDDGAAEEFGVDCYEIRLVAGAVVGAEVVLGGGGDDLGDVSWGC